MGLEKNPLYGGYVASTRAWIGYNAVWNWVRAFLILATAHGRYPTRPARGFLLIAFNPREAQPPAMNAHRHLITNVS